MRIKDNQRGFTLLELSLYITIIGVFLFSAMQFSFSILDLNNLSKDLQELEYNRNFITQKIVSTIQDADDVNDAGSTFDDDEGVLSLDVSESAKSPTVFSLSDGDVYMQQGAASPIKLNTDLAQFTKLNFQKISSAKTPDQIVLSASIAPQENSISNLEHELEIHVAASLRKL